MEDFTQDVEGLTLCTYNDLGVKNQPYTFDEILSVLATDTKLSIVEREKTIIQFWSMFLCDAILGNSDRHQSNWGF